MASSAEVDEGITDYCPNFLSHDDPLFWHGRAYCGPEKNPNITWKCDAPPRDDHDTPPWLTASEFQDDELVQKYKVRCLARLLKKSRKTVLYTGAGISASAVGQAARSGQNKVGWKSHPSEAKPTPTHFALGILGRMGLIASWVQQNHDGLPQKSGFQQELLNEIHGSWFNPSNPVVKYSGNLHTPCYEQMLDDASTADLVLVLGTSLGGLNADQVATRAAERSLELDENNRPISLGTVCINLQQTPHDGEMTLRLFGKSDDYLKLLLTELGLDMSPLKTLQTKVFWPKESRVLIPYDSNGRLLKSWKNKKESASENPEDHSASEERWMWLDLSIGSKIQLVSGHNCVGSGQPQFKHITHGRGSVVRRNEACCAFTLNIEGATMKLGFWWLDSALRGAVEELPVVNLNPQYQLYNKKTVKVGETKNEKLKNQASVAPKRPKPVRHKSKT